MRKRKSSQGTSPEWNKRHKENTPLGSATASIITGSSSELPNRKGQLHP
ncbi:unnamed protein product [Brassica oleracea var. botrytis]